jgi:hypothetical protein
MAEDTKKEPIRVKQPGRDTRVTKPPVKKAAKKKAAKKAPAKKKA